MSTINYGIKFDLTLNFLRGKVHFCNSKSYNFDNGIKKFIGNSTLVFNRNGTKTETIYFKDDSAKIKFKQIIEFDNFGNKTGFFNVNPDGIVEGVGKYRLDNLGRKITVKLPSGKEEEYSYDEAGNVSLILYVNTGAYEVFEYDDNGLAINKMSISGEKSLFSEIFNIPKDRLTIYENDPNGNILQAQSYDLETSELMAVMENKFNKQGDIIEMIQFDPNTQNIKSINFSYVYDDNGNWIKKITSQANAILSEESRTIIYFD